MSRFPREPEGYWAYSLVYAVRKDVNRSLEYMKKAVEEGISMSRFSFDSSPLFEALTESRQFQNYIKEKL